MFTRVTARLATVWLATLLIAGIVVVTEGRAQDRKPIVVFAASSLTEVVTELGTQFTRQSGVSVKPSFAASSALARQIEAGAPAAIFFSADEAWMDYLQQRKRIVPESRRNVAGNSLVLVAPASSNARLEIRPGFDLLGALGNGRLATGDPDAVPVGKYAREALTNLGVWTQVQSRLVRADNVRAALAFVARGEVPFGIVYATDAKADPKVRVVDEFPRDSHAPIRYPIALIPGASPDAARFIEFIASTEGRAIFERYGFPPPP